MSRDEDGFAAGDTLAALTILAVTIVLSLRAVETARHAALVPDESRRATALLGGFSDAGTRRA